MASAMVNPIADKTASAHAFVSSSIRTLTNVCWVMANSRVHWYLRQDIAWLKGNGKGYQSRLNDILRQVMLAQTGRKADTTAMEVNDT